MPDLNDLLAFLSDSAPDEVDLADRDQVALEARRFALISEIHDELADGARRIREVSA